MFAPKKEQLSKLAVVRRPVQLTTSDLRCTGFTVQFVVYCYASQDDAHLEDPNILMNEIVAGVKRNTSQHMVQGVKREPSSFKFPVQSSSNYKLLKMADFEKISFTDISTAIVVIRIEEKRFNIHKDLLIARSTYFKATFEGGFKEAKDGQLCLENVKVSTMQLFLDWLYFGRLPHINISRIRTKRMHV